MDDFTEFQLIFKLALNLTKRNLEYYENTNCTEKAIEARILNIELCVQMYIIVSK